MKRLLLPIAFVWLGATLSGAQSAAASPGQPFVVEYCYKTKWGHAEEFLKLFKKNHYPLLEKEVEMGRLLKVWMDQPRYHTAEDGRWDYRVTIVFKNATVANEPFDEDALKNSSFPTRRPTRARSNAVLRFSTRIGICQSGRWIWRSEVSPWSEITQAVLGSSSPGGNNDVPGSPFGSESVCRVMEESYRPTNIFESCCRLVAIVASNTRT